MSLSKKRARFFLARTTKLCAQNVSTILANHLRLKKSLSSRIFIWKTRPIFEFIEKEGEICHARKTKLCAQNIATILAHNLRLKKSNSIQIFIWKTRPNFEFIEKEGEILPCAIIKIVRAIYNYNFSKSFATKKIKIN